MPAELYLCPACDKRFSMESFQTHFEICNKARDLTNKNKAMYVNLFMYTMKKYEVKQLILTIEFANYRVLEGQKYPQIPCFCEGNPKHPLTECLAKYGEPEMKQKGKVLMDEAIEHYRLYQEHLADVACEEANSDQIGIWSAHFSRKTPRDIARRIGTGYTRYIQAQDGQQVHEFVLQMMRKVNAVNLVKTRVDMESEKCKEELDKRVEELVGRNSATINIWDQRWERIQRRRARSGDSDTSGSAPGSPKRVRVVDLT